MNVLQAYASALGSVGNVGGIADAAAKSTANALAEGATPTQSVIESLPMIGPVAADIRKKNYASAAGTVAGTAALGGVLGGVEQNPSVVSDLGEAVRAGAPDVAAGAAKTAIGGGIVASRMPGSFMGYLPARNGLRQIASGLKKGKEAFQAAHDATGENVPMAGETAPPSFGEAAPANPDAELLDGIAQGMGKTKFKNLSEADKKTVLDLAQKLKAQPESAPAQAVTPRPASHYGVQETQPEAAPLATPAPTAGLPPRGAFMTPAQQMAAQMAARTQAGGSVANVGRANVPEATVAPEINDTYTMPATGVLPAPAQGTAIRPPLAAPAQPQAQAAAAGVAQPTPEQMAAPFAVDQAKYQASQNRSALMGAAKHMGNRKNAAQGIADYAKSKGYDDPEVMAVAQPEHWQAVAKAAGYPNVSPQTIAAAKALLTKK